MSGKAGHSMVCAELWLIGTRAETAALVETIRQVASVLYLSPPYYLTGVDTGRVRRYLRLAITAQLSPDPPSAPEPAEPMGSPPPNQPAFPDPISFSSMERCRLR